MSRSDGRIAVADIGGTHARFAIATRAGTSTKLDCLTVFKTADFPDLESAWRKFRATKLDREVDTLVISFAGPIENGRARLTNGSWSAAAEALTKSLGLKRVQLINDLAAIARSVPVFGSDGFEQMCGPSCKTPRSGPVSVIGLGTGLGVALLINEAPYLVISCEGGHADFAPHDGDEAEILARLRKKHGRVSWERMVSGSALKELAAREIWERQSDVGDRELWQDALENNDPVLEDAVSLIVANLGSVAGDISLIQGSQSVVLAGGLANRLKDKIKNGTFEERFLAKGRMQDRMSRIPVHLLTRDDAGLIGASHWLDIAKPCLGACHFDET